MFPGPQNPRSPDHRSPDYHIGPQEVGALCIGSARRWNWALVQCRVAPVNEIAGWSGGELTARGRAFGRASTIWLRAPPRCPARNTARVPHGVASRCPRPTTSRGDNSHTRRPRQGAKAEFLPWAIPMQSACAVFGWVDRQINVAVCYTPGRAHATYCYAPRPFAHWILPSRGRARTVYSAMRRRRMHT